MLILTKLLKKYKSKLQWGTTLHRSEWLSSKNLQIINAKEGVEKKETLLHCWCEYKLVKPLLKTVWRFLKKLKTELPYDPAIPFLGTYPDKTLIGNDTCISMFTAAALFTIAKTRKQPKHPWIDEWIKKTRCVCVCVCVNTQTYIYTYTEILSSHFKMK